MNNSDLVTVPVRVPEETHLGRGVRVWLGRVTLP